MTNWVSTSKYALHITEQSGFACFSRVKCKTLSDVKTFFIQINLGLSEAASQGPAAGARRARKMATSKRA